MRLVERQAARKLQVERDLGAVADFEHRRRCGSRAHPGRAAPRRALARRSAAVAPSAGSTWTTTSASRASPPRPRPRLRPRPHAPARPPRRGTPMTTSAKCLPAASPQPEAPQLDRRLDPLDRRRGCCIGTCRRTSMSTSTFRRDQAAGGDHDEHGDEERRPRRRPRVTRPRTMSRPTSTAIEPPRSLAKWKALAASAGLRYRRALEAVAPARVDRDHDPDDGEGPPGRVDLGVRRP